jgi:glycosyltransferase involved in cell wall biosynthesis
MNVLFLTNAYPDFDSSYRGIFIKKMGTLLKDEGYSIAVVTPKIYKKSRYFEEQGGIKIYRFPFLAGDKLLIEYRKIPYLRMLLYYISGFFVTAYAALKKRSDVIHVHWAIPTGLIGVWVARLLKKPLVVTIHGSDFRMATERFSFLTKIFLHVCQRASQIICVSDLQKNEIQGMGVGAEKISTIPMGISESFANAGACRQKKLKGESHNVLSNRNLLPLYNVSLLIRAIPEVIKEEPCTKFFIAGDGSDRESLEKQAEDLNLGSSVQFLGRIPHEKMPDLLSRADIYVSTSLHDGTSASLLEAMASGAFPIVTDIPANREWIMDGENGYIYPIDDEKTLARKILVAIHDKELLARGQKSNQSVVKEKALWPVCIEKIKGIYDDQLSKK